MKVSREQVSDNRRRILDAASILFRARGFDSVTVAEVMKAAGLTHGGFYGHFKSKDDLIAQALGQALAAGSSGTPDLASFADRYLSPAHRADPAGGCPTAALGGETSRQSPDARGVMTAGLRQAIERFSQTAPGVDAAQKRQAAIGSWAAMVGAMVLARMSDDVALSDEVLAETRAWIARREPSWYGE